MRQDRRRIDFTPLTDEFLELSGKAASEDTALIYEKIERNARLYEAVEQLSEIQKRRVYLYYFRGLKHREIAELEGVNQSTVGHSLQLALKRLHKILAEQ
ncbi:MAG: Sigma-70, region 4 [Firmicutes bacterium]|nr:Sigma-70, region 4 [Bacillota bacterium]